MPRRKWICNWSRKPQRFSWWLSVRDAKVNNYPCCPAQNLFLKDSLFFINAMIIYLYTPILFYMCIHCFCSFHHTRFLEQLSICFALFSQVLLDFLSDFLQKSTTSEQKLISLLFDQEKNNRKIILVSYTADVPILNQSLCIATIIKFKLYFLSIQFLGIFLLWLLI